MRKVTSTQSSTLKDSKSYTTTFNSLSTIVDRKTMEQVHYDLENPSEGTVSLNRLLQQIDREKQS